MDIKEFVKTVLVQVMVGAADAERTLGDQGLFNFHPSRNGHLDGTSVDFDIAVQVDSKQNIKGDMNAGGNIKVLGLSVAGGGKIEASDTSLNSTISRIQFSIGVDRNRIVGTIQEPR
jgi:hypothetical protein